MLRHILTEPALIYSDVLIDAAGFPHLPAREFFRRFEQISANTHDRALRGYWGTVISVEEGPPQRPGHHHAAAPADIWLNSGPPSEPSILIRAADLPRVLTLVRRHHSEDLVGCYVLVLGECRTSAKGKLYITPASPHHITFRDTDQRL